jgi:GNAT superfamily N-acetyltransferase
LDPEQKIKLAAVSDLPGAGCARYASSMHPMIRPLAAADFGSWLPLWQGYLTFYQVSLSDEQTALTFNRLLDPEEPTGAFVCVDGDAMLGFAHYLYHRSTWVPTGYCYLEDLFTQPAARGKGVARLLIRAVADAARKQGAQKLYWQTNETNATARALYDAIADNEGFIVYSQSLA